MKKIFVSLVLGVLSSTLTSAAEAKSCEGSTDPSCSVQFFCVEVSPFIIPIEVEIWNTSGTLSLHKFAVRSDDTRADIGSARVRETNLRNSVLYLASGFPQYQLEIDNYNGDSKFTENVMGRTLITPMICLQPVE